VAQICKIPVQVFCYDAICFIFAVSPGTVYFGYVNASPPLSPINYYYNLNQVSQTQIALRATWGCMK